MNVLDLGGRSGTWTGHDLHPARVVCVNVEKAGDAGVDWCMCAAGDACDLGSDILADRFDLVYSNSVLEHVGGHWRRQAFAETVHRAAPHHWVQTPSRYFPLEPHWLFPGFQFLPTALQATVSRRWSLGHRLSPEEPWTAAFDDVLGVELVGRATLQYYFPTSTVLKESFLGLTKSLIAVR